VLNGFRRDIHILSGQPFKLSQLTLRSYQLVFKNAGFRIGMRNSIIVGLLSTFISLLVGAMASYGIARFKFKGRNSLAYSFLVLRMLPQVSLVIALYLMFSNIGLRDTISGLTLAHTSFNVPYVIWLLLPFLLRWTGHTKKQQWWTVARVREYSFGFSADCSARARGRRGLCLPQFLERVHVRAYSDRREGKDRAGGHQWAFGGETLTWGQACAAGTIMLIPVFIFTLGMQKFLIRGITAGGVKG